MTAAPRQRRGLGSQPFPRRLPSPTRIAPVAARLVAAVAAGTALLLAFPPYDLWPAAPAGAALLALAVHRTGVRAGAALGGLAGAALFLPLLSWTSLEVGAVPWLLLAATQAAFLAALGAAAAYTSPLVDRVRWLWPLLTAVLWVGQEALRSRIPFGGFPWGRLAFSQADAPTLPLASVAGAPLVTTAVAAAGGFLALGAWHTAARLRARTDRWSAAATAALSMAGAAAVTVGGALVPPAAPAGAPVTVAVVQGNVPRLGLDFADQRQAVLDNHVEATLTLAEDVAAGHTRAPDLVVWPENSSDLDPLSDPTAAARIREAAEAVDAPVLVGAIVREDDGSVYNVGLVWEPATGPADVYAKRHPVPFAEYLPLEPVVAPVARAVTDAADRITGFTAGTEPGVLSLGPATVGNVICFEVAYDGLVRDTVTGGGQLLTVQTNNATFNEDEARQQLAMVRLRAVEHGREALMASTVGISGFVDTDGQVSHPTGFFTRDVPVRTLTLANGNTMATAVGPWPEFVLAAAALAALGLSAALRRRPDNQRD